MVDLFSGGMLCSIFRWVKCVLCVVIVMLVLSISFILVV